MVDGLIYTIFLLCALAGWYLRRLRRQVYRVRHNRDQYNQQLLVEITEKERLKDALGMWREAYKLQDEHMKVLTLEGTPDKGWKTVKIPYFVVRAFKTAWDHSSVLKVSDDQG